MGGWQPWCLMLHHLLSYQGVGILSNRMIGILEFAVVSISLDVRYLGQRYLLANFGTVFGMINLFRNEEWCDIG